MRISFLLAVTASLGFWQSIITTVAGRGSAPVPDNIPAIDAPLFLVSNVALDGDGNLYIAEASNHRIRRVTPAGTISTVAGNGTPGYSDGGGDARLASLWSPHGVALDTQGNLYIADTANARVRRVTPAGTISTVAGNGTHGYSGDGGDARLTSLWSPQGVALDTQGNLYIADMANARIRRVSPAGTISTVAGNGKRGFSGDGGDAQSASLRFPRGVALDTQGNLYIADEQNHRIRRVTPAGTISTVAGNGKGGFSGDGGDSASALLWSPFDLALDTQGNLYIADEQNHRIRRVTPAGTISTVAGNGKGGFSGDGGDAQSASLRLPRGVALDTQGNLYIADPANARIRRVTPAGTISTVAGNGTHGYSDGGGDARLASLWSPQGVALDTQGNLYIADEQNHRIRRVTPAGTISTVAGNGTHGYSGDGGDARLASLDSARGVALDTQGNLYIADTWNRRVRKVVFLEASVPITLDKLLVSTATVVGGDSLEGTVVLSAPPSLTGIPVFLHTLDSAVEIPPSVFVLPGETSADFPITTQPVPGRRTASITASFAPFPFSPGEGTLKNVEITLDPQTVLACIGEIRRAISGDIAPGRPTVVITHGWQPQKLSYAATPPSWVTEMADAIKSKVEQVNVLTLTWSEAYGFVSIVGFAGDTSCHGEDLAYYLLNQPGLSADQPIHFIGHSLGTLVNAHAANILAKNNRTKLQVTLLDHPLAPLERSDTRFFQNTLTPGTAFIWVENYYGDQRSPVGDLLPAVGVPVEGAYNLQVPGDHSGVHEWYRRSIDNFPNHRQGFYWSITAPGFDERPQPLQPPERCWWGPLIAAQTNAASFQIMPVAPGELVTLFGCGIGSLKPMAAFPLDNRFPTVIADTRVYFGGLPAPLLSVGANQVNTAVPFGVAGKAGIDIQLEYQGIKSPRMRVNVADSAPGLITVDSSGSGQAAILNHPSYVSNSPSAPAPRGSYVIIYGTGGGQTDPPSIDGEIALLPAGLLLPTTVEIGGIQAEVLYAGAAGGDIAGLNQINAKVPEQVTPGDAVPVTVNIGVRSSQPGVTLAIK